MIICSKREENGAYREFVLDDREFSDKIAVKTHIARGAGDIARGDDWRDAGVITRCRQGLEAAVVNHGLRGKFVKLDKLFSNEIAALQAIALHYEAEPALAN